MGPEDPKFKLPPIEEPDEGDTRRFSKLEFEEENEENTKELKPVTEKIVIDTQRAIEKKKEREKEADSYEDILPIISANRVATGDPEKDEIARRRAVTAAAQIVRKIIEGLKKK